MRRGHVISKVAAAWTVGRIASGVYFTLARRRAARTATCTVRATLGQATATSPRAGAAARRIVLRGLRGLSDPGGD